MKALTLMAIIYGSALIIFLRQVKMNMDNFQIAFEILMSLEFNEPSNYLHKNKAERDYTVAGIYKAAHPNWLGWFIINDTLQRNKGDVKAASRELYKNTHLTELVMQFYKEKFWDRMRLDELHSSNTAVEIFIFAVNSGTKNAIRKAQKVVGILQDGLVGRMTLSALNNFDRDTFDMKFDEVEIAFYDDLIKRKPSFAIYQNGWHNRARTV